MSECLQIWNDDEPSLTISLRSAVFKTILGKERVILQKSPFQPARLAGEAGRVDDGLVLILGELTFRGFDRFLQEEQRKKQYNSIRLVVKSFSSPYYGQMSRKKLWLLCGL